MIDWLTLPEFVRTVLLGVAEAQRQLDIPYDQWWRELQTILRTMGQPPHVEVASLESVAPPRYKLSEVTVQLPPDPRRNARDELVPGQYVIRVTNCGNAVELLLDCAFESGPDNLRLRISVVPDSNVQYPRLVDDPSSEGEPAAPTARVASFTPYLKGDRLAPTTEETAKADDPVPGTECTTASDLAQPVLLSPPTDFPNESEAVISSLSRQGPVRTSTEGAVTPQTGVLLDYAKLTAARRLLRAVEARNQRL